MIVYNSTESTAKVSKASATTRPTKSEYVIAQIEGVKRRRRPLPRDANGNIIRATSICK